MGAAVMLTESEMMGDLFRHNIAVLIECDPDSMPPVTCKAFSRLSPTPVAVVSGASLRATLATLHEAVLGDWTWRVAKKKKVAKQVRTERELMHWAWAVIANAYEGNWNEATPEWKDAATTWRDRYHDYLKAKPPLPELIEVDPTT